MMPYLRVISFDDDSGGLMEGVVKRCAEELKIDCVFRFYPDDYLVAAEAERVEKGPVLWLVDLLFDPKRTNNGRLTAWNYIEGLRKSDPKLDEYLNDPEISDTVQTQGLEQGLATILSGRKFRSNVRIPEGRFETRLEIRVCSNIAKDALKLQPLLAYAATGEATSPFEQWGIDKHGLRQEGDKQRHPEALKGLKDAMQELAFQPVEPLNRRPWPLRFLEWEFLGKNHLAVIFAFLSLVLAILLAFVGWPNNRPPPLTFERVQFGVIGQPQICVAGKCDGSKKIDIVVSETDSVELDGTFAESAFITLFSSPKKKLPAFTEERKQFKVAFGSLKGRKGLNFLIVVISNKPMTDRDKGDLESQLAGLSTGKPSTGDGLRSCEGFLKPDLVGEPIKRGCDMLGDFINKDATNRHALLVAFSVKPSEPVAPAGNLGRKE